MLNYLSDIMRQKIVKAERPMILHPSIFIQNLLDEWKVLRVRFFFYWDRTLIHI
jgi:hypothetical protein